MSLVEFMRLSRAEAINSEIGQIAEHLAGLMHLTPEWIEEHGTVWVSRPVSISRVGHIGSFIIENDIPVGENYPTAPVLDEALLVSIDAYDFSLIPGGRGFEKSGLTGGFI